MATFPFSILFYLIPLILCVLAVVIALRIKKENKLLSQQLTETIVALEATRKQLAGLEQNHENIKQFQSNLQMAELTTRLQKPRLDVQAVDTNHSAPEKYRYFQSLAERGMSSEEIASILGISAHETRQLIILSNLARGISYENMAG